MNQHGTSATGQEKAHFQPRLNARCQIVAASDHQSVASDLGQREASKTCQRQGVSVEVVANMIKLVMGKSATSPIGSEKDLLLLH